MCTGLVTLAPFLGSTKNTRTFFAAAFLAAGFLVCALAKTPNPATITRTGSTSCLLIFISDLLSRTHSSRDCLQTTEDGVPSNGRWRVRASGHVRPRRGQRPRPPSPPRGLRRGGRPRRASQRQAP